MEPNQILSLPASSDVRLIFQKLDTCFVLGNPKQTPLCRSVHEIRVDDVKPCMFHIRFFFFFFFFSVVPLSNAYKRKITGQPPFRSTKNRHKHAPQTFLASIRTTALLLYGHMSFALLLNGLRTSFSSQLLQRASQGFMKKIQHEEREHPFPMGPFHIVCFSGFCRLQSKHPVCQSVGSLRGVRQAEDVCKERPKDSHLEFTWLAIRSLSSLTFIFAVFNIYIYIQTR